MPDRPPGRKRTGPQDATPEARINAEVSTTDTAKVTRCRFLHPSHLTGCRRPAEPGSVYCATHGGAS